ncbi:MAG: hypothetical protein GF341_10075 [candidate division Zixibacteria bacterium]|nr:hypothetical protein [candidate division Zixibacteria bacterium]
MSRIIVDFAKRILPAPLHGTANHVRHWVRSRVRALQRLTARPLTASDLAADLRKAGVSAGDAVMVHSSLSQIGRVADGADTVVQSLIDVIGPNGTVMMPCYNSAAEIEAAMREGRTVDLRSIKPNTGMVTDRFRQWPGVVRSSHPFSSVCAWGEQAEYVIADHASHLRVCHKVSPIARQLELNTTIIGLGVPISVGLAVAHYIEDTYDGFPFDVHAEPFEVTYIDAQGRSVTRDVARYDPVRSKTRIDHPEGAWILERFTDHFTRRGILHWFTYGRARAWTMNIRALHDELMRLLDKGITMYLTREEWTRMNDGDEGIEFM